MHKKDHRMGPNYKKNHPNGNTYPSQIDRSQFRKAVKEYWKNEFKKFNYEQ